MIILIKILQFLLSLSIIVIIHEFGHFIVARWLGVKVLRFSVGFGRVLWSWKYGADQTEFAINNGNS